MELIYAGPESSEEELFQEIKRRVSRENVRNFEGYDALIDELLNEKLELGHLAAQGDTEQIRENLKSRWMEIKDEMEGRKMPKEKKLI